MRCGRIHAGRAAKNSRNARLTNESPGNPLYELLAEEQRDRVRNVIAQLKPIQGQVLLMGSSGFTCKEIAARTRREARFAVRADFASESSV